VITITARRVLPVGFVEPCIPTLAAKPPSGPDWVHEIKHDGYRLMVRRDGDTVRLFTVGATTGPIDIRRLPARPPSCVPSLSPWMERPWSAAPMALPCSTRAHRQY
jgi:hypothetical protein